MNQTNCSLIHDVAVTVAEGSIDLMKTYKWFVVVLAILGLVAVLSTVFSKSISALTVIGYILSVPIIIILGLINKKKRKERIKDLKEIGRYIKDVNKT